MPAVPPYHLLVLEELIGGADLDEVGEGAYYLHLHRPCGFAAVNYQQS